MSDSMISEEINSRALVNEEYAGEPRPAVVPASMEQVVGYYERKTQAILRRYGPGPRVHFHTGFADEPRPRMAAAELRSRLCESQERMVKDSADAWQLRSVAFREVLDVGCGLGGGAIFWAENFGSDVTAITNVPSHVNLVATFSAQAGVRPQVHPFLCDALEVPGKSRFDAIIAIDSSCHLSRRAWFRRVAQLLRQGGHLFIADCFLERNEYRAPFDRHWRAQIGTIKEYLAAAQEAQLTLRMSEDVSQPAANFWTTTIALIRAEAQERRVSISEGAEPRESLQIHSLMRQGLLHGGLRHQLLSFTKE
jgi:cyclopropane fatty-acyl-phospholipid synthase-like methyltransferase